MRIGCTVKYQADRGGGTEEKGASYSINDYIGIAGRHFVIPCSFSIRVIRPVVFDERCVQSNGRYFRHAMNEQDRAKSKTDNDCFRQVSEDRKQEGNEQDGSITIGSSQKRGECMPLEHCPRNHDQYACKTSQRDEGCQRCCKDHK